MSVGILIITHDGIGQALFDTTNHMFEHNPLKIKLLSAGCDCDPDKLLNTANQYRNDLDEGDGILVLTDLIGSTPSNIAYRFSRDGNVNVVAGINLSMLVRVFNYPNLNLAELTSKALSGGIDGITTISGHE